MLLGSFKRPRHVVSPTLADVEYLPERSPSGGHGVVWINLKSAIDQIARLLVFLSLHAVHQRNRQKQEAGGAIMRPPLRLSLDEQNERIYLSDDAGGDELVQLMQLADRK